MLTLRRRLISGLIIAALALLGLGSLTQAQTPERILIDGSSTVHALSVAAARRYSRNHRQGAEVTVNFSGTRGGFRAFCHGETDIQNASRPIVTEEIDQCSSNGVEYIEIPVAMDAVSIVAHPSNNWANDITLQELRRVWEPAAEGQILSWSDIRSDWPDRPLKLYGRGRDSGTYDYFTQVVVGQGGESRLDYVDSEDVEFLVEEVNNDPNALGFFDIGSYLRHWEDLKPIAVDSGNGPIFPTLETMRSLSYRPLTRPLFLYINVESLEQKPQIADFVASYLEDPERWIPLVRFMPLSSRAYQMARARFEARETGSLFRGRTQVTVTIEEALSGS